MLVFFIFQSMIQLILLSWLFQTIKEVYPEKCVLVLLMSFKQILQLQAIKADAVTVSVVMKL